MVFINEMVKIKSGYNDQKITVLIKDKVRIYRGNNVAEDCYVCVVVVTTPTARKNIGDFMIVKPIELISEA